MDNQPNEGVTLDELIEIARSMDCELHLEFVPKCPHKTTFTRLVPPGIIVTICQDCGRVIDSKWWTRSNG